MQQEQSLSEIKKYNRNMTDQERKEIPKNRLAVMYDKDDNVLFGSRYIKGKVMYYYIPAELMEDNVPFILYTSIAYDGKGNTDLPIEAEIINYDELYKRFYNNQFPGEK